MSPLSSLPPCCCHLLAPIILWHKLFLILEFKIKNGYHNHFIKETKNYYTKNNFLNYNPNMYYPPPLSNLLKVEPNPKQNNMIFHQSFSIARIILQLPSIVFYFISMSHTHLFLKEGYH